MFPDCLNVGTCLWHFDPVEVRGMPRPFGLFDIAKRCPYISYRDIFTGTGCLSVFQMGFEALAEGGGEVGAGLGAGVEAGHGGEGVGFGDAGLADQGFKSGINEQISHLTFVQNVESNEYATYSP